MALLRSSNITYPASSNALRILSTTNSPSPGLALKIPGTFSNTNALGVNAFTTFK